MRQRSFTPSLSGGNHEELSCAACASGDRAFAAAEEVWRHADVFSVLPKATNAEASEYAMMMAEGTMPLQDPRDCMKMIAPGIFGSLTRASWGEKHVTYYHDRMVEMQKRVAHTAATKPNPPPTEAEAKPVFDRIIAKINNDKVTLMYTRAQASTPWPDLRSSTRPRRPA